MSKTDYVKDIRFYLILCAGIVCVGLYPLSLGVPPIITTSASFIWGLSSSSIYRWFLRGKSKTPRSVKRFWLIPGALNSDFREVRVGRWWSKNKWRQYSCYCNTRPARDDVEFVAELNGPVRIRINGRECSA